MADSRHVVLDTAFGSGEQFLASVARHRAGQTVPASADGPACAAGAAGPAPGAESHLHYLAITPAIPEWTALPALAGAVPALGAQWPLDVPGLHRLHLPHERMTLDLLAGPAEAWLPEIVARVDAFIVPAPLDQIRALQRLATPAATLRIHQPDEAALRSLRAAGFSPAGDASAQGWQHFAYTSRKPQPPRAPAPERRAIVIGAGVAGSAACERLAARGWQVTLIERHASPAQEASGNVAGIFMPLLSKDDNIPTRLTRAAYLYAQRAWQHLGGIDPNAPGPDSGPEAVAAGEPHAAGPPAPATIRGHQCGVLQLARDAGHAQLQKEVVDTWRYPEQYVRWLDAQQASAMLGAPTPYGAWHFPLGGWATPATACRAMLQACGDRLQRIFHSEALRIERTDSGAWQVLDAAGRVLASAPTVILANGAGATGLQQASDLPLYTMRGQVTHLREGSFPSLQLVVCREAYMTPPVDGTICVGATYDKSDDRQLWQASQDENLLRAEEILGAAAVAPGRSLQGRVGFRTMAPDRLPLVGALPDSGAAGRAERLRDLARQPGLYALLGYASRGLIWAPLAAEILACQLEDEPLPIEATLAAALDPGRFLLKQRRKL